MKLLDWMTNIVRNCIHNIVCAFNVTQDIRLDGEKTMLHVTAVIFSSMWIFTNISTSNSHVFTKFEKTAFDMKVAQ